jgi:AAA+ ATPase superfamily predicted ATPase
MNLIEQMGNSLWNFRSYHSLSRTRGGKSFLYIFLLFLLFYMISGIYNGVQMSSAIDFLQNTITENVPDFSLSNGKFSFAGDMPFKIEDEGYLFVIDTTGQTTLDDFKSTLNGMLITEDELIVVQMGKSEITPFSVMAPLEISKDQVVQFLPTLKVLIVIAFAAWFLFAFAGKLFGILLLALIAMIATAIFNKKLTFLNQWNVAIYASTLPMLIKLVHTLLGGPIGGFLFFIYWGVAIIYVFLGIYYIPNNHQSDTLPRSI